MMRAIEGLVFLTLATGLHIGVWSAAPRTQGASASGGPGQAQMTLAAATPQYAAMAQSWQAPPDATKISDLNTPAPATPVALVRPADIQPGPSLPPAITLTPVLPAALPNIQPPPSPPTQTLNADPAPTAPKQPTPAISPPSISEMAPRADTAPPPPPGKPVPRPKARPAQAPSAAAPAARASGGGQTQKKTVGKTGKSKTQSTNAATLNAIKAKWGRSIQRKVHRRMIYPRGQTESGVAHVVVTVDRSGRLTGLRLAKSSGNAAIDKAAFSAVRRAGRFSAAPAELTEPSQSFSLKLNFEF